MTSPSRAGSAGINRHALHRTWALLVAVLTLLGLSCVPAHAQGSAGATPPGKAWIRVGHFVPGAGAVRVDLLPRTGAGASIVMSPNAGYGDVTSYQKVEPGTYTITVRPETAQAGSAPMLSRSVTVTAGKASTVAVVGSSDQPRLAVLSDDLALPAAGSAKVRVLSASALAPTVTVTAVGGPTITSGAVLGQATGYVTVPQGTWTLNLIAGGGMSSKQTVTLTSGSVYTAVVLDSGTDRVTLKVITDAAGAMVAPVGGAQTGGGGTAGAQASPTTAGGVLTGPEMTLGLGAALLAAAALSTRIRRLRATGAVRR